MSFPNDMTRAGLFHRRKHHYFGLFQVAITVDAAHHNLDANVVRCQSCAIDSRAQRHLTAHVGH